MPHEEKSTYAHLKKVLLPTFLQNSKHIHNPMQVQAEMNTRSSKTPNNFIFFFSCKLWLWGRL